ncbi:MAG: hypothetical protein ACREBS_10035 [Nitrososphaerales archaeon]
MEDGEESIERERRKLLVKSLPFMLNSAWEAHTALSPANLASTAISEFQKFERNAKLQEEEVRSLTHEFEHLELKSEGTGRLSLTLTRDELLELIGNYLVSQFLNDGSAGSKFTISSNYPGYDGMLSLPSKAIFTKLIEDKIDQHVVFGEIDEAETLNPAEVWMFSFDEDQRSDIRFGPVFVSENRILFGRFRLIPVTDLLKEITNGHFSASIESRGKTRAEGTRFLLTRLDH